RDFSTISRARARTAGKSTSTDGMRSPNAAARRARWAARADAITAFVGVQPQLTQDPPTCLRSASPTRQPELARETDKHGPDWPAPMIKTLKKGVFSCAPQTCADRIRHSMRPIEMPATQSG